MIKKAIKRGINSFLYAAGINLVICTIILAVSKDAEFIPVVPEFAAHFASKTEAMLVQLIMIGLSSAVFGAGSVIMELERLSLLVQSILYFIITSLVWVTVSCVCWQAHKYLQSLLGVTLSYTISYIICWVIQYRVCKKSVEQINQKLKEMKSEEKER